MLIALLWMLFAGSPARADPACPPSGLQITALPRFASALREGGPLRIVAFGSSSTEGVGASAPDRTYPALLEAKLREALPGHSVSVLNRGRGGEEAVEMMRRLDVDVLRSRPTLVIWQAGSNAVLRGTTHAAFRAAVEGGLSRLHAAGVDVLLMDSQRAPRLIDAGERRSFDGLMASIAVSTHTPLFSRAEMMREWFAAGTPMTEVIGPDGLHHTDRGYQCLSTALAASLLASGSVAAPAPMTTAGTPPTTLP